MDRAMPPTTLKLEAFLPYRLSRLTNIVSQSLAAVYRERFQLSIPQWRVMAVLAQHPGISANEAGTLTAMDKVTVSRAIAGLIAAGRIDRRTDETDRRRSILRLNTDGRRVYDEIVPVAQRYENSLREALPATQQRLLDTLLDDLTQAAERLDP